MVRIFHCLQCNQGNRRFQPTSIDNNNNNSNNNNNIRTVRQLRYNHDSSHHTVQVWGNNNKKSNNRSHNHSIRTR